MIQQQFDQTFLGHPWEFRSVSKKKKKKKQKKKKREINLCENKERKVMTVYKKSMTYCI